MIELGFSIEGEKQLSRKLNIIPGQLGDLTNVFTNIGQEVKDAVDKNYSSRGSLFGSKWVARKDKKTHPLLELTGAMRGAFEFNANNDYVEIFNTSDYFAYHQSNKPRRKLPRRIMLKLDQIRKQFIVKEFQRHIQRTIGFK